MENNPTNNSKIICVNELANRCQHGAVNNSLELRPEATKTSRKPNTSQREEFTCRLCSKYYKFPYQREVHARHHLGMKPFKCKLCPFRRNRPNDVDSHFLKQHAEYQTQLYPPYYINEMTDEQNQQLVAKLKEWFPNAKLGKMSCVKMQDEPDENGDVQSNSAPETTSVGHSVTASANTLAMCEWITNLEVVNGAIVTRETDEPIESAAADYQNPKTSEMIVSDNCERSNEGDTPSNMETCSICSKTLNDPRLQQLVQHAVGHMGTLNRWRCVLCHEYFTQSTVAKDHFLKQHPDQLLVPFECVKDTEENNMLRAKVKECFPDVLLWEDNSEGIVDRESATGTPSNDFASSGPQPTNFSFAPSSFSPLPRNGVDEAPRNGGAHYSTVNGQRLECKTDMKITQRKKYPRFKCALCTKALKPSTRRTRHAISHLQLRPYKCSLCPSAYTQGSSATHHYWKKHPQATCEPFYFEISPEEEPLLLAKYNECYPNFKRSEWPRNAMTRLKKNKERRFSPTLHSEPTSPVDDCKETTITSAPEKQNSLTALVQMATAVSGNNLETSPSLLNSFETADTPKPVTLIPNQQEKHPLENSDKPIESFADESPITTVDSTPLPIFEVQHVPSPTIDILPVVIQQIPGEITNLSEPKAEGAQKRKKGNPQKCVAENDEELRELVADVMETFAANAKVPKPCPASLVTKESRCQKCELCSKVLDVNRSTDRSRHALFHMKLRPYECVVCQATFNHAGRARSHFRNKHPGIEFVKFQNNATDEDRVQIRLKVEECFPNVILWDSRQSRPSSPKQRKTKKRKAIKNELMKPFIVPIAVETEQSAVLEAKLAADTNLQRCQICLKIRDASRSMDRKRHALFHMEIRPWQCVLCQENFTQAGRMKAHFSRKHPNMEYIPFKNNMTDEEKLQIRYKIDECFPNVKLWRRKCVFINEPKRRKSRQPQEIQYFEEEEDVKEPVKKRARLESEDSEVTQSAVIASISSMASMFQFQPYIGVTPTEKGSGDSHEDTWKDSTTLTSSPAISTDSEITGSQYRESPMLLSSGTRESEGFAASPEGSVLPEMFNAGSDANLFTMLSICCTSVERNGDSNSQIWQNVGRRTIKRDEFSLAVKDVVEQISRHAMKTSQIQSRSICVRKFLNMLKTTIVCTLGREFMAHEVEMIEKQEEEFERRKEPWALSVEVINSVVANYLQATCVLL